jgi:hypothetical protein
MSRKKPVLAVVMGDIVASEAATSVKVLHRAFNRAVAAANKAHEPLSPLTITLGDEFQGLANSLSAAWEIVSSLRLRLLQERVRCRFVIGAARVETPINTERAWNMMGPGLADARERLSDKQAENAYRFSLPDDRLVESLLDAIGESLTSVEDGWTPTQLKYYAAGRSERTNAKVAASLGVSERSFYKVLRAARADFHGRQSSVIAEAMTALDQAYGLQ